MRISFFLIVISTALPSFAQNYLKFSEACSTEENIEISAVGDILLHSPLAKQAVIHSNRFVSLWSSVLPAFDRADLSYANLEGPVASGTVANGSSARDPGFEFDGKIYSSYPQFNYHPYLISDLVRSGIDVVSIANNHTLDRRASGVDRTIEALDQSRLAFTGAKSTLAMDRPWHTITQVKGRNIAWLACTFSTNGIADKFNQVLPCYKNSRELLEMVRALSSQPEIDAVIVTPHWGEEYQHQPQERQISLGRLFLEAGATAVIGTHPHVVQPWEKYQTKDGREGFIIYSTGNFVSGQPPLPRRVSLMVQLHLTSAPGQKLKIRGVQFLPLYMQRSTRGYEVIPVLEYNREIPAEAVSIWKKFYHENQRIRSFDENVSAKICKAFGEN